MCVVVVMCHQQDAATRRIFIRLLFISWPPSSSFSIPSERKKEEKILERNREFRIQSESLGEDGEGGGGKKERKKNISIISPLSSSSSSWHGASL